MVFLALESDDLDQSLLPPRHPSRDHLLWQVLGFPPLGREILATALKRETDPNAHNMLAQALSLAAGQMELARAAEMVNDFINSSAIWSVYEPIPG